MKMRNKDSDPAPERRQSDGKEDSGTALSLERNDGEASSAEEIRSTIDKFSRAEPQMASSLVEMMGMGMMPMSNPLHQKMEGSHITQLLELAAKHDEREYDLRKTSQSDGAEGRRSDRRYYFASFFVVVVLVVVLLVMFKDQPDILIPALTGLGGLISGFIGGWGVGKNAGNG